MKSRRLASMFVALAVTWGCGDDDQDDGGSTTSADTSTGPTTGGTQTGTTTTTTTATETSTDDSGSDATTATTMAMTTGTTTGADSGSTGGEDSYAPCSPDNPCAEGICWTDGDVANVCGAPCTMAEDCPAPQNGEPVCVEDTQDPGSSYCIIPCADDSGCPDGMQCVELGNSSYCFWGP